MRKIHLLVVLVLLPFFSFAQEQPLDTSLKITQGNKSIILNKKSNKITLKRDTFSIDYLNKSYLVGNGKFRAAQVLVTEDKLATKNYEGISLQDLSFFSPGTGFAPAIDNNKNYPINSTKGHQYLFYASEKDKRVEKVGTSAEWDIYQWTIHGLYQNSELNDWKNLETKQIYIYFFIDYNLNQIIDKGEYHLIRIKFKN
ncbi:hypothetical protein [Myroides injenensis]|uniref:hypothetical protein n=1 Tax=Myroides injenensis TaxID=1183151 RepID=UPI0002899FBB|nr:hypothetical protein [Myroides injenensis]